MHSCISHIQLKRNVSFILSHPFPTHPLSHYLFFHACCTQMGPHTSVHACAHTHTHTPCSRSKLVYVYTCMHMYEHAFLHTLCHTISFIHAYCTQTHFRSPSARPAPAPTFPSLAALYASLPVPALLVHMKVVPSAFPAQLGLQAHSLPAPPAQLARQGNSLGLERRRVSTVPRAPTLLLVACTVRTARWVSTTLHMCVHVCIYKNVYLTY